MEILVQRRTKIKNGDEIESGLKKLLNIELTVSYLCLISDFFKKKCQRYLTI